MDLVKNSVMKIKIILFILLCFIFIKPINAQLKFIVEDFEGLSNGSTDMQKNGVFSFGNIKAIINQKKPEYNYSNYLGERYITVKNEINKDFGGWGKGIGLNVELDPAKDHLNFYVYQPIENGSTTLKVQLQEDDNDSNIYESEQDDEWIFTQEIKNDFPTANWQLISIPLSKFKDSNIGGDGIFNCTYKNGKLLCFIISFKDLSDKKTVGNPLKNGQAMSFDFICFSEGEFSGAAKNTDGFCSLGLWSKEGNVANFVEIGKNFEELFKPDSKKKLGVVHFFQPFAIDGGSTQNHYPSIDRINKVIAEDYIPMITLENHFTTTDPNMKQPNLYSIIEGHFDSFFGYWANQIKQVKGIVFLRILHEFNGDWYPWSIANNDKDPKLLIKAYGYIHNIFKQNNVTNVKFIWCPNSMSVPQEKWNYIMDAYPGDEFVDFVGLDIYNGAGLNAPIWASFRRVAIENYFILTEQLPDKPLFICETASRERENSESKSAQTKAEWIKQQSEAIKSDMPKVKLLNWFNEKSTFKINSSSDSRNAFLNYILKDDYFKSGTTYLLPYTR